MSNPKSIERWILSKKKHNLTDKHIQMVRELGLKPDKLDKSDKYKLEPGKYHYRNSSKLSI